MKKVISYIENVLDKYDGNDPLYLSSRLMELLIELRQGEPQKYSNLSGKIATQAKKESNYDRARTYWAVKAKWDEVAGNKEAGNKAKICMAESYVKNAEQANSNMVASSWLGKAIEEYRRIGGSQNRIEDLHKKMIEIQKGISTEMKVISQDMDISEMVDKYRTYISGLNIHVRSLISGG